MSEIVFKNLRMTLVSNQGEHSLSFMVASGFADYEVSVLLTENDYKVLKIDHERAAFVQAIFHHYFQLKETYLDGVTQRQYLDLLLYSPVAEVETFLTDQDHGVANGAISNMVRLTCDGDYSKMREGKWFKH